MGITLMALVVVLSLSAPLSAGCGRGAMYMKNNGYHGMLVAVGEDVPESTLLINRIKQVFTATSQRLYQATRRRAYLAEVKILVPHTWTRRAGYQRPGKEQVDSSDILLTYHNVSATSSRQNDVFVVKATGCGEPGHFMYLNPQLLLQPQGTGMYGPIDKVLIHEFAHLRYGVFDEYPAGNDPHFYSGPGGTVEATRCSREITGWMYDADTKQPLCKVNGSMPDANCRFGDKDYKDQTGFASLMYHPFLSQVDAFCDGDGEPVQLHNPDAPNMQNRRCNGQSVWEVMRMHKDFANLKNPPRFISKTAPRFTVFQQPKVKRYVLVLDVSRSMTKVPTHMPNLGRSCSNFLLNIVRDGEKVGIVLFSNFSYTAANLTEIDEDSRMDLVQAIPRRTQYWTCMGCGVREAIQVLKRDGGTAAGGNLIVISDGRENRLPSLLDVTPEVFKEKVTIHSIAFTNGAGSNIDKLAGETGGLSFLYNDAANSNALHEAFKEIAARNQDIKNRKIPISSEAWTLDRGQMMKQTAKIDSTLGRDIEFIFDYAGKDIDVKVTSPTGKVYGKTDSDVVGKDTTFGIYMFKFKGQGEVGTWMYIITNTDTQSQKVSATVVSRMSLRGGKYPILAQAYWGYRKLDGGPGRLGKQKIFASVSQGFNSVLRANVQAIVERPDKYVVRIPLKDNGIGADLYPNDGIYSGYFKGFKGNKRYNVKVIVNSEQATTISSIRTVGTRAPTRQEEVYSTDDVRVTHMQRMASGGSFELINYRPAAGKLYEPDQVMDLRVAWVDVPNRTVQLTWTAPGAELDEGKVSFYELRYATDFSSMRENFTDQAIVSPSMISSGSLRDPSDLGMTETITIKMPAAGNITYVFCVVSKDLVGRTAQSAPSNLVSAGMVAFSPHPTTPRGNHDNIPNINKTGIILLSILCLLMLIAATMGIIIIVRHISLCKNAESRPSTPDAKDQATKSWPLSWGSATRNHRVGPTSITMAVAPLQTQHITRTTSINGLSRPKEDKCTLVNLD